MRTHYPYRFMMALRIGHRRHRPRCLCPAREPSRRHKRRIRSKIGEICNLRQKKVLCAREHQPLELTCGSPRICAALTPLTCPLSLDRLLLDRLSPSQSVHRSFYLGCSKSATMPLSKQTAAAPALQNNRWVTPSSRGGSLKEKTPDVRWEPQTRLILMLEPLKAMCHMGVGPNSTHFPMF